MFSFLANILFEKETRKSTQAKEKEYCVSPPRRRQRYCPSYRVGFIIYYYFLFGEEGMPSMQEECEE